jgi:hypothetical protein
MIYETVTEAAMVSINGAPPQSVRQKLRSFKITDDDSFKELQDDLTKGREIILSADGQEATYILTRELVPSKIALPGKKQLL